MKTIICSLIHLLIVITPFLGYSTSFEAGLKAGAGIASANFKYPYKISELPSFNAGFHFRLKTTDRLFFQPELLYSVRGYRAIDYGRNLNETIELHYLALPLIQVLKFSDNFAIAAGPEAGYLLNASDHAGAAKANVYRYFRKVDLGVTAGLEYSFTKKLRLELRYYSSLFPITNLNRKPVRDGQNRLLLLNLAYAFSR